MNSVKLSTVIFCLALGFALCIPNALASIANQATRVNFNQPVQVPGLVLPAGTYWFTIMPNNPDRNVVQIWNQNRTHLVDTVLAVPNERLKATGKTVIKFKEMPSKNPEALRAWFYPGDRYGHEFVYPQAEATQIAKGTGHPVLSMRDEMASNMKSAKTANDSSVRGLKQAQVEEVEPNGKQVPVGKAESSSNSNEGTSR